MKHLKRLAPAGSGGGGKGGSSEDANTLRSKSIARILDLLGEGELELVDGDKSIFLDDVPLRASDGTLNFQGVSWAMNTGIADQPALPGFSAIETEVSYGVEVKKHNPATREITNPLATSARVTIRLPALAFQDDKGNVRGSSVSFRIEAAAYGGAWENPFGDQTIDGKCTAPYDRSYRLKLPTTTSGVPYPWSLRVTRLSNDADDQNDDGIPDDTQGDVTSRTENHTFLQSITEIVERRLSYPWTAHIGLVFDAKTFGSSLPTRSYLVRRVDGLVPSNYDPVARTYTGIWDGTFVPARNDNVAWAVYDMLSSKRFGLGRHLSEAALEAAKWDFYEIGRYFDELVPDGFGGTEPRATFNGVIKSQKQAYDLIALLMSACRGMTYWSSGAIRAVADQPTDPIVLAHRSNVIDGNFSYQGTALKSRHTVVHVAWNDPDDQYRPAVEVVEDQDGIRRYGRRVKEISAVGCSSRGQARRIGLWLLETELRETQIVTYRAGFDHAYITSAHPGVVPGDVVAVQDDKIAGIDWGGRLLPGSTVDTLILDREVTISLGADTTVSVRLPSGVVETRSIANVGTVTSLMLATSLSETPAAAANWIVSSPDLEPRPFRVVSVAEVEPHIYEIKGLLNDVGKYARVDNGVSLTPRVYTKLTRGIGKPVNLSAREYQFIDGGAAHAKLTWSWSAPSIGNAVAYHVVIETPAGEIDFGNITTTSVDLSDVVAGVYTLNVAAVTYSGKESAFATAAYTATGWTGSASPSVTDLALVGGDTATAFSTRDVKIAWTNTLTGGGSSGNPFYLDTQVTVSDASDGTVLRVESVRGETWTYPYSLNATDAIAKGKTGAVRALAFSLICRDTLGRVSNPATLTVTNPAPAAVTPNLVGTNEAIWASWTSPTDLDFAGMLMWVGSAQTFTPSDANLVYDGPDGGCVVPKAKGTWWVVIAPYDAFGKAGLNLSSPTAVIVAEIIDTTQPDVPTNLAVTTSIVRAADGTVSAKARASVDASPSANFGSFEFSMQLAGGDWISWPSGANVREWSGLPVSTSGSIRVRAMSKSGIPSAWCTAISFTTPANTTAPAAPTALAAAAAFQNIFLSWTNPTDSDLAGVEVWAGTTSTRSASTKIATITGTGYAHNVGNSQTRYYWVRAINTSGVAGAYNATTGVSATTSALGTTDITDAVVTTAKFAAGIEPVTIVTGSTLPTVKSTSAILFGGKLYRWNGTAYVASVASTDISGTLADSQIAAIAASKVTGQLTDTQIAAISAAKVTGQIIASQIADAAITAAKFAGGIEPVTIISSGSLPTTRTTTAIVYGFKIYRWNGTAYVASVDASDILGQISAAQIASIAASQVTGQLSDTQLAAISAAKVTGQIIASQIADAAITTAKFASGIEPVTNVTGPLPTTKSTTVITYGGKLYRWNGTAYVASVEASDISGTLAAAQISSIAASQVTGQLTDTQIAAISAAKISGQIVAAQIADAAITDAKIAGLAASKVTGQLSDAQLASISAAKVTGQIISAQIADAAVTTAKFASGIEPVTNVTGSLPTVKSTTVITYGGKLYRWNGSAYVASVASTDISGTISAAQIASIAASQVTGQLTDSQIAAIAAAKVTGQIVAAQIADAAITDAKIVGLAASKVTGTLADSQIAAIAAAKVTGQLVASQIADAAITTAKFASGIEPVTIVSAGNLPTTRITTAIVYGWKIYRWNGTAYIASVDATDISGTLAAAQIASIAASQVTGQLTDSQISAVAAAKVTGQIVATQIADAAITDAKIAGLAASKVTGQLTDAQLTAIAATKITGQIVASQIADAAVTTAKFASGLEPVTNVTGSLPTTKSTTVITFGGKLYRWNGTAYVASVDASDVSGTISAAQIASIAASQVTGQLSDTQITAVAAAKVTGQLVASQIADAAITTAKFASGIEPVTNATGSLPTVKSTTVITYGGKLYRWNGTAYVASVASTDISGTLTDAQIAAIAAAKVTGQIVSTQITDGSITTAKVAAGAITASLIAASTITSSQIAANAITATQLAAGSVTTAAIAAGAVTAANIAADTITSSQIAAGAITASEIATGAVTAQKLVLGDFTNRCEDPHFGEGGAGWQVISAGVSFVNDDAAGAFIGDNYVLFGAGATGISIRNNNIFPVIPGEIYYISATAKYVGTTSSTLYCRIRYMGADKSTFVSAQYVSFNSTDTSYVEKSMSSTVPAGAVYAWIDFNQSATFTEDSFAVGAVSCQRKATGSLIVDGTITAVNIAANTITASQIATDTITAANIAAGAVTSSELATGSVVAGKIAAGTIRAVDIAASTITGAQIAANTITASQIAADTITAAQIAAGAITASEIATGAVVAGKIAAGAITATEIAASTITGAKIAAATISAANLVANTITAAQIAAGTITSTELAAGSVVAGKIAAGAVQASNIVAGTITGDRLAASTITGANIAASTITAANIAADTITAANIAAGAISSSELATGAVVAGKIAAGAITATEIAASTITGAKIAANTITAANIAADTITAAQIAAGAISASEIASNAITTDKLLIGSLTNLVDNPTFIAGSGCWSDETKLVTDATNAFQGDRVAARAGTGSYANRNSYQFPVVPGQKFYVGGYVKTSSDAAFSTLGFRLRWLDASGVENSSTVGGSTSIVSTTWTSVFGFVTVPSSIVKANLELVVYSQTAGTVYWSSPTCRDAAGVLIEDGAVTASKILTGTITATQIAANTITASEIATGTITATQLSAGSVTTAKIAAGAVTASTIAANTITASQIAANTITAAQIATGAITASTIAAGAITTAAIATGAITATQLAAGSVVAGKIAAGTIQAADIAANTITSAQIAANTITASQIAADTITAAQIAAGAITSSELAAGAVVAGKIAAGAITATEIAASTITGAKIAATTITGSNLVANTITAAQIASATITATQLAAGAVTAGKIAAGTIQAADIAAGAITTAQIAASTITGANIAGSTITAANIAADTITAAQIAAGAVTASEIATGAVTTAKIAAGAVTASTIAASTITGAQIAANTITSSNIAADTITAANIAAGAIGASEIASNAITTDKLLIGAFTNLVDNPTFVAGSGCWDDETKLVTDSTNAFQGDRVATRTGTGSFALRNSYQFPVVPGQKFYVGGYVKTSSGASFSTLGFRLRWLDASGVENGSTVGGSTSTANTTWTSVFGFVTVPSSAVKANLELVVYSQTAGTVYWSSPTCRDAAGVLIEDGVITASKIATNTITAAQIAANTITAAQIAVGTITATQLAAGSVTTAAIAAGTIQALNIAAGTITGAKIAANTITAANIAADTITAAQIAAGAISASELATNAVTAKTLFVGDYANIFAGANVESTSGFVGSAYGIWSSTLTYNGNESSLRILSPGVASTVFTHSNNIPVISGEKYYVSFFARTSASWNGTASNAKLRFGNASASNALIFNIGYSYDVVIPDTWTQRTGIFTVPAGCSSITVSLGSDASAGDCYISDLVMRRMSSGELIVDGAITASKIAANTIIASNIAAGAITAAQIAAGAITATQLSAGSVTTAAIAAGTIQASNIAAGTITGAQISANTITAANIAADTITAAQIAAGAIGASEIAAGAITADKIAVGMSANWLENTDFQVGLVNWAYEWSNGASHFNWSLRKDTYAPPGGALQIYQSDNVTGLEYGICAANADGTTRYMDVIAGEYYQLSVYYLGHRCNGVTPFIGFIDKNNNVIQYANAGVFSANDNIDPQYSLASYNRAWFKVIAPVGAVKAIVFFRMKGTVSGSNDSYLWLTRAYFGPATVNQTEPSPWVQSGATLIQGGNIVTGAVTAAAIAAGAITADKITAGAVTATAIASGTITGDKIAANTIAASSINLTGGTSLSSWLNGSDATKIEGGAIAGNSISANSLKVGARGLVVTGIDFQYSSSTLSWTAGSIAYINDAGTKTTVSISAGSVATTATTYVYWVKDATSLSSTTTVATAIGDDRVEMAVYSAGGGVAAVYGGTIIDGARIVTGTIQAAQIASATITATQIASGTITAAQIAASTITGSKIAAGTITATQIAAGAITTAKLAAGAVTATQIATGSITADKLSVTALSSISANIGTVTAGVIQSSDGKMVIDLSGSILISD